MALFVKAKDRKEPTKPDVITQKVTGYVGEKITIKFPEDSVNDGYKWVSSFRISQKNWKVASSDLTDHVQRQEDTLEVIGMTSGSFTFEVIYANQKNRSDVKHRILQTVIFKDKINLDWLDDYDFAKKKAAKENKHILLLFTGSDWCNPCKQLESEILETKIFADYAKKYFVGAHVSHPKFGKGVITQNTGINITKCVSINFEEFGVKTLSVEYAPITLEN